jgi:hypothetical protein
LFYDIIRISEAYIENVFFKRPIIKVWFLGDSATYVDIKRTNYNGFYDISDTTDRNKLIIAILEEKINDIDLDKNTDFLGFFRMYKNDLWKMSGGRKILRDDYQFNKNNLFIFSDFLHDPKPNPGSSKDSDSCHLVNVLDSIEETQTNPSVHFMKAKREFVNGTTQVNKMLKAIFKDNCNVYSIYDSSFTLLKQRDTNFFYFTYKIPSHGSVRSVDFSLRRQENLAVKLSWVGNHTHYNPQFSLCLYSQDTCLDKLLLRNGLERDLTTAISKNRIDKFNIQYKGNVQPPYSEMELSIRNRLYGITTIHLLYFVKVYNLPVFVLLLILFLAMVILYSSLLYTTFSKIFPEIKQQVKNWLNEFFGGIGTNFKRIFVRYRNCYSLYCSPLADVFV